MVLKKLVLVISALSFGFFSSAGVFTVLASLALVPRFAARMHLENRITALENGVVLGALWGGVCSLLPGSVRGGMAGELFLTAFGGFSGIFNGCLAFAIAEMLDSIPIFARRCGFKKGLSLAVSAAALGKLAGSLLYFAEGIFLSGM